MTFITWALTAAIVSAGSNVIAIVIGMGRSGEMADAGGYVFAGFMAGLAALPYGIFLLMDRSHSDLVRRSARVGFGLYVAGDLLIRLQVFLFPQSSTDAVALVTYPFFGTGFALLVAVAIAKWRSHA